MAFCASARGKTIAARALRYYHPSSIHSTSKRTFLSWFKKKAEGVILPSVGRPTGSKNVPSRHVKSAYNEEHGSWEQGFHDSLRKQDPHDRITSFDPYFDQSDLDRLDASFGPSGEKGVQEIWNLPFWTVCHLVSAEGYGFDRTSGVKRRSLRTNITFGYSVPAVSPDHWASGMVLTDDILSIIEEMRTMVQKGPQKEWVEDQGDQGLQVPASRCPSFSTGYPVLSVEAIEQVLSRRYAHIAENVSFTARLVGGCTTFAIPTRRHVCKTTYSTGEAYWDGFIKTVKLPTSHLFMIPKEGPKIAYTNPKTDPAEGDGEYITGMAAFRYVQKHPDGLDENGKKSDEPINAAIKLTCYAQDHAFFATKINQALVKSELNWEDPNIMPISSEKKWEELIDYCTAHIRHKLLPPKPVSIADPSRGKPTISSAVQQRKGPSIIKNIIPSSDKSAEVTRKPARTVIKAPSTPSPSRPVASKKSVETKSPTPRSGKKTVTPAINKAKK